MIFNARYGEFSINLQFVKLCKVHFWLDFLAYICSINV
nr:MAG TPA: hypothetical protein [Caudoviricetes sp.]